MRDCYVSKNLQGRKQERNKAIRVQENIMLKDRLSNFSQQRFCREQNCIEFTGENNSLEC